MTDTYFSHHAPKPRVERGTVTTETEVELPAGRFALVKTTWRFRVWYDGPENGVEAELISRTPVVESIVDDTRDIEITPSWRDFVIAAWENQHEDSDERDAEERACMDY